MICKITSPNPMETNMRILFLALMLTFTLYPSDLLLVDENDTHAVSLYKQNYFIFDGDRDAKFQLSYRIRLYEFSTSWNLFISHTHKADWAITTEESAPFREHNFNPEIHLRWKNDESSLPLKHLQIGFEHESTGVAGPESRGWNRLTCQAEWTYFSKNPSIKGHLHMYLRAWIVVNRDEDNNPDIDKQLGPGEIQISYTVHERWKVGGQVALTFRKKSIMAEYGFKTPKSDYFYYVQYWNGRGEWLGGYNKDTNILRAGFKFYVD